MTASSARSNIWQDILSWLRFLDSDYFPQGAERVRARPKKVEVDRCIPFLFLHLGCLGVFFVGSSTTAILIAAFLYFTRAFALTGFYHRYFSHRSFRTSRLVQFIFAVIGASAVQRGPLWWAAHHRQHHRYSDKPEDVHSPVERGFWWAHIGWITTSANMPTDYSRVSDFARYPELVLLNRFDWVVPALLAVSLVVLGECLKAIVPSSGTSGPQLLVWGFFISTVVMFHVTSSVNSLGHMWGSRRYDTPDDSRNNPLVAVLSMGEGWHNNHHRYMSSARQGFFWWEIDLTYYILKLMSLVGLVTELRRVPEDVLREKATAGAALIS